jgi:hypothetical protein
MIKLKGRGIDMKKWNRFKLDILYYLSAIDLALTGFAFTVRYVVKHRRIPKKSQKYSREEILEELKSVPFFHVNPPPL